MALLTGFLWYGQFFFYGLGHVRMGNYKFSSWAIHMILLVLLSSVTGLIMKEWKNCSAKTMRLLMTALVVLVVAVLLLTYGNYLRRNLIISTRNICLYNMQYAIQKLPVFIIGAGGIVNAAHLPAYKIAGFNVQGIFDIDHSKAKDTADKFNIPYVF